MLNPKELRNQIALTGENKENVEYLLSKYKEPTEVKQQLLDIIPDHDRLLVDVLSSNNPKGLLYDYHFLLIGLVVRSKLLVESILREVVKENEPASSILLRAQCETLCSACYVEKFPDKLEEILHSTKEHKVNIMTQLEHAEKKYKGLTSDYDQLSEMAHPNSVSHFSSFRFADEQKGKFWGTSGGSIESKDAVMIIRTTLAWTAWILDTLKGVGERHNKTIFQSKNETSSRPIHAN